MKTREEIKEFLDRIDENVQFLSPNEPITPQGIQRVLDQMSEATADLEKELGLGGKSITMWNPNIQYSKNDIVLYFKQERKQVAPDVGIREFAFILISTKDKNDSVPNYDLVDGIPNFVKSNWKLINPMSYLLQDLIGMKKVVKEVFEGLLQEHVEKEHGLIGAVDIDKNLVRKDYSNLLTPWRVGKFSLVMDERDVSEIGITGKRKLASNGIMEYQLKYSLEEKANQQEVKIEDRKYYYDKSPIFDESDQTIFSRKYMEDSMISVIVNPDKPIGFNNLRYGTNIFHKQIDFSTMFKSDEYVPFVNDEYMVFFDTYGSGEFVFGYDKNDIQAQTEPTYDAVVSMPMLMNKRASGFDIVLPIHTYFNSMQKYNIGVPWNNVFTLQVIGRYK